MQDQTTLLQNELIEVYGQLLLDPGLIFAIILAWSLTHFIKQYPGIRHIKPADKKSWVIRVISAMVGFIAVIFLKRHMLQDNMHDVINFAVMVAFVHPVLYKVMTALLDKFLPSVAQHLKSK